MEQQNDIAQKLSLVQDRINKACKAYDREPATVKLLLATKTVPAEKIRMAVEAGTQLTGENKVQELRDKAAALADLQIARHFIGHLQTNKVKEVLRYASCIQSVDRITLVEELDKRLQAEGRQLDIMIQVNTSYESSKFGIAPDALFDFVKQVRHYDTLNITGLMTIGLFDADAAKVKPSFRLLKTLQQELLHKGLGSCNELSMGMSGDLETAIAAGSTMVRVGTAVFGQRHYPDQYYWNENNK